MSYPLPLTRTEAYLAYKAGVIQQSDLKPSLAVPRIGIDAWLAYWTELAADYPKNPDGTPMILQEEEAYIAYLCGVINEYPEKCLRRVGAYLRYIISARWGRPDHPLNREELYLSLIKTQFIPSGDPSSDIVIDGTAKAAFVDVKMYGDTFQQSYSGKNLFNIDNYSSAILRGGGSAVSVAKENATTLKLTNLISQGSNFCGIPIPNSDNLLGKSVTISGTVELGTGASDARVAVYAGSSTSVGTSVASTNISASGSFTLAANIPASYPSGADRIHYVIYASGNTSPTVGSTVLYSNLQLEVGSVTDYEPYVGGIASPNPTYPQPIQVVTGTQTVAINGTNYPLDLGTIELCKLGTYQDYIWKDNGDWKVHKATKKITLNGSEEWLQDSNGGFTRFNIQIQETIFVKGRTLVGLSSHFVSSIVNAVGIFFLASTGIARRFYFYPETTITTVNGFKSWLESNNTTLLYPLDTATDTEITDATLISQLNAIASASLENGSNTITNTATGSNLAGDMEVDYFGYDPTNRYDKWLWLDINNAYEKLGS